MSEEKQDKTYNLKLDIQTYLRLRKIEDYIIEKEGRFIKKNEIIKYLINDYYETHKDKL